VFCRRGQMNRTLLAIPYGSQVLDWDAWRELIRAAMTSGDQMVPAHVLMG